MGKWVNIRDWGVLAGMVGARDDDEEEEEESEEDPS